MRTKLGQHEVNDTMCKRVCTYVCVRARTYVWTAWQETHAQSGMCACPCVRTDAAAAAVAAPATTAAAAAALCPGGLARSASSTRTYTYTIYVRTHATYVCKSTVSLAHVRGKLERSREKRNRRIREPIARGHAATYIVSRLRMYIRTSARIRTRGASHQHSCWAQSSSDELQVKVQQVAGPPELGLCHAHLVGYTVCLASRKARKANSDLHVSPAFLSFSLAFFSLVSFSLAFFFSS